MTTKGELDPWRRLARAVATRRAELRLNQGDLHPRGGPSLATVQSIESARTDTYRQRTLVDLERALDWKSGSVDAVLAGGEPTPFVATTQQTLDSHSADVIAAVMADPNLLPEAKQHLVNQYGLLLRVQQQGVRLPAPAPAVEPLTQAEQEFVAQGRADLARQAELRVVDDSDQSCQ